VLAGVVDPPKTLSASNAGASRKSHRLGKLMVKPRRLKRSN